MILAVNTESFVGCSLGEATAALATASAAPAPANVLAVSPAEEAAARRVMSLPRPGKKNKRAMAVSREINCDLEDEEQRVQFETIDIRRDEDANNDSGVGVDLVGGCDTAMVSKTFKIYRVRHLVSIKVLSTILLAVSKAGGLILHLLCILPGKKKNAKWNV